MSRGTLRRGHTRERGAVGGGEGVIFGMLILVAGTLVILNLWSILDTRMALEAAAGEYLRTYTEQQNFFQARVVGEAAAKDSLAQRGITPARVEILPSEPQGFGPCAVAVVQLRTQLPWVRVPFIGGAGSTSVSVTQTELIDAHREVTASANFQQFATPCASN
ncbi:unannotated protein [freshwater metagenome]|uniref:Unannotated protein n=1 Tax=freshwater metagenome TaxID=449393 RepID=A0A6J7HZQ2_9ZZZZ|nr:hypothetical protein [Actinomycetota bacterium]MTA64857.1 hypothetical protein [Actinomycetota bacterium]